MTAWLREVTHDPDYLAARLHARRSSMAEGERLDTLCRLRSLPELTNTIFPRAELKGASDFQRLSVSELVRELTGFLAHISGPGARLVTWALVRFQVENIKILLRISMTNAPAGHGEQYMIALPEDLRLDAKGMAASESLEDFVRLVPKGIFRKSMEKALETVHENPRPFFLEAALDQAYFRELMERVKALPLEDREIVTPMACQEVDIFHLMLAVRGKFHYGLAPDILLPLHIAGTRISRALFTEMLHDPDVLTATTRLVGRALDWSPPVSEPGEGSPGGAVDMGAVEHLAWRRFLRLSNLAFRRSHMGLGAVIGYVGLRRLEVANLTTISEGIEKGIAAEAIRAHLILPEGGEVAYA